MDKGEKDGENLTCVGRFGFFLHVTCIGTPVGDGRSFDLRFSARPKNVVGNFGLTVFPLIEVSLVNDVVNGIPSLFCFT